MPGKKRTSPNERVPIIEEPFLKFWNLFIDLNREF
jgi:hypothetical protein